MFSKACEYGIKAVISLAQQSKQGRRMSLKAVAEAIDSPVAFTAKILQTLAGEGIICSVRGAGGGYEIPTDKRVTLNLAEVVRAIDGDQLFTSCALGFEQCGGHHPCPLHSQFGAIREQIKNMLENSTVDALAEGLEQHLAFLKG